MLSCGHASQKTRAQPGSVLWCVECEELRISTSTAIFQVGATERKECTAAMAAIHRARAFYTTSPGNKSDWSLDQKLQAYKLRHSLQQCIWYDTQGHLMGEITRLIDQLDFGPWQDK